MTEVIVACYNKFLLLQVAINSLMRILRDPSLASYHLKVVGSLMFIFKVCVAQDYFFIFIFYVLF